MHEKRLANPNAKRPTVKNKELDKMIEKAWAEGWWADYRSNGHVMCYAPNGGNTVLVANTPSDHRTVPNTKSYFRRAGLAL